MHLDIVLIPVMWHFNIYFEDVSKPHDLRHGEHSQACVVAQPSAGSRSRRLEDRQDGCRRRLGRLGANYPLPRLRIRHERYLLAHLRFLCFPEDELHVNHVAVLDSVPMGFDPLMNN